MGIENQTEIHYALPVKNGVYDFLRLSHQVSEAASAHRQAMKDVPLSLKEMYSNTDSVILEHTPDYHVNLIAPREMSDDEINEFHSNLREVMLYIKYSEDKKTLNKVIKEDIKFQSMERQAAQQFLLSYILIKEYY